jgi:zinc transporter ZupT
MAGTTPPFVHSVDHRRGRLRRALRLGFLLGAAATFAAVVGSIVLGPESNQGPLLGILIAAPAGFAVGVALGLLPYRPEHRRRK